MKARIRRKIIKQFATKYLLDYEMIERMLACQQWVPQSAKTIRRQMENMLDQMYEYGYGRYCR